MDFYIHEDPETEPPHLLRSNLYTRVPGFQLCGLDACPVAMPLHGSQMPYLRLKVFSDLVLSVFQTSTKIVPRNVVTACSLIARLLQEKESLSLLRISPLGLQSSEMASLISSFVHNTKIIPPPHRQKEKKKKPPTTQTHTYKESRPVSYLGNSSG